MTWIKKGVKWLVWGLAVLIVFVGVANIIVVLSSSSQIKEDIRQLENASVALVLGTSKSTRDGTDNLFFSDRMKAATDLFQMGKVKHIIVSGDNRTKYYNEPQDMLEALQMLGVPTEAITLDYAGFRTLDSVVRCKEIFEQENIIIVTQKFHAYRAVFIAVRYDIQAQAYASNFKSQTYARLLIREFIARSLAVVDLYLLNKSPKYLGEKEIPEIAE